MTINNIAYGDEAKPEVTCQVGIKECNNALLATTQELEYTRKLVNFYQNQAENPMTWESKVAWTVVGMAAGVVLVRGLR